MTDESLPPVEPAIAAATAAPAPAENRGRVALAVAGVSWLVGFCASAVLALHHLSAFELPGCSVEGGCAAAAASDLGVVGGLPLSFWGVAYFASLAAAWLVAGFVVTSTFTMVTRVGALVSATLTVAMLAKGLFCHYCLATHVANVVLWVSAEFARRRDLRETPVALAIAAAFLLSTTGLYRVEAEWQATSEADLRKSLVNLALAAQRLGPGEAARAADFTMRHRLGSADAPVQLLLFVDYQCPHCKDAETTARKLVDKHAGNVALTVKNFPMCTDCNRLIKKNMHPKACRAACLAEAAGILGGEEGFWRVHEWLREREARFTDEELHAALPGLGFADVAGFIQTADGAEALQRVTDDIKEATPFNPKHVPLVLVNFFEIRLSPSIPLERAVEELLDKLRTSTPAVRPEKQ